MTHSVVMSSVMPSVCTRKAPSPHASLSFVRSGRCVLSPGLQGEPGRGGPRRRGPVRRGDAGRGAVDEPIGDDLRAPRGNGGGGLRSEERRVGKEWRSGGARGQ